MPSPGAGRSRSAHGDLASQGLRRDRAVGSRSKGALVQPGDERREQLPFPHRPIRRAPHDVLEEGAVRRPPELGAVVDGLDDVGRLAPRDQPHESEEPSDTEAVARLEPRQAHRQLPSFGGAVAAASTPAASPAPARASSPALSRAPAAPYAAATV